MKSARTFDSPVENFHSLAAARERSPLVVERVDNRVVGVILSQVRYHAVFAQLDQSGRRLGQPLLGVRRIGVMRRDDPPVVAEIDLERRCRGGRLVVVL